MPTLVVFTALPGHTRPSARGTTSRVDPRVLDRVRKLLAKAESTTYPAEAETFTAGAQAAADRAALSPYSQVTG